MIIIVVIAAGLRFYNITSKGIWYWDEAYYSNIAKAPVYAIDYLLDSKEASSLREYLMNRGAMGMPFIKPGHILLMTISYFLMGVNDYSPAIMMSIVGIALIFLVFKFGKEFITKEIGVFAALILAVSGHFIFYSRSAYPQMDTVFFGMLGYYYYLKYIRNLNYSERKYLWYSGASFSMGMLMHQSLAIPILIFLAVEAIYIWREKRDFKSVISRTYPMWGQIIVVYLAVMLFSKLMFTFFPEIAPRTAFATLGDRTFYRLSSVFISYSFSLTEILTVLKMILTFEGILVLSLTFYGSYALWTNREKFGKRISNLLLAQFWIVVLYWSFFSGGHPTGKAFMVIMPQLALIAAIGIQDLLSRIPKKNLKLVTASIIAIWIISFGIYNSAPMLIHKSGYGEAAAKAVQYAKEKELTIHREQGGLTPILAFYLGELYDESDEETKKHINAGSKELGDIIFFDYRRYFKPESNIEVIEAVKGYEPFDSIDNGWVIIREEFFTHYGAKVEMVKNRVLSQPDYNKIWLYDISEDINRVLEEK